MNRTWPLCSLVAAVALLPGVSHAVQRTELHDQNPDRLAAQYRATAARTGLAATAPARHAQLLQLEADSQLQLKASHAAGQVRNLRYQQTFRGVPIYGEQVVVSERADGSARTLFGRSLTGLASEIASTTPRLGAPQALLIGQRAALAGRTRVENAQAPLNIFIGEDGHAHLAYIVSYFADRAGGGAPIRPVVVVDANTGRVLRQWDSLDRALVGTGPGGNLRTGTYEYGSGGRYGYLDVSQSGSTCTMNTADVKTVNLNGGTSGSTAFSFTCPRNTVKSINGANSPLNDAHYIGGVVNAMYTAYTGAKPWASQLVLKVHYSSNLANAWWDGTQIIIGDGDASYYPLTSADILGHEITHAYVDAHSDLGTGEAASINEAFADMGGEATEYYWKGSNDFQMGVDVSKNGVPLRYMDDPTRDNYSIAHYANYSAGMEKYKAAGIYNKAFYLLATTPGWDTGKAFKVFARANRDYWTPTTGFVNGACGVETATADLGLAVADVSAAFLAVGIDCPGGGNAAPVANFSSSVNGLTVSFTDASSDSDGSIAARSWNFGDGATASTTNPSHTYAAAGTYTVTLTVTDNAGASNSKTQTLSVGSSGSVLSNGVPATGIAGAAGSQQFWTLQMPTDSTGLKFVTSGGSGDADLYVKYGAPPSTSSYDCKSEGGTTAETCSMASALPGTWYVMVRGYTAFSGVSLTGSYTISGPRVAYTNNTDYAIKDNATVESPVTVSGRSGNAPADAQVQVNIVHTYIGDLKVDLVAPDGSLYNIHNRSGGSADNINKTVTLNLSSEAMNGTWKLRVNDNANGDTGYIDSWSLVF